MHTLNYEIFFHTHQIGQTLKVLQSALEVMEQQGLSSVVRSSINWHNDFGKQFGNTKPS